MNPEEGDLRPQLLDRFALSVEIHGIRTARERVQIMERNMLYEADGEIFRATYEPKEFELSQQIEKARELVGRVQHSSRDLLSIASLTASLNVEGHRSDLVILKAARAQAAFEGRTAITDRDIAMAAELALPHRIRRGPFQDDEISTEELQDRIEQLQGRAEAAEAQVETSDAGEQAAAQKKT
jgi:Mg-chelatase subunit ChlI